MPRTYDLTASLPAGVAIAGGTLTPGQGVAATGTTGNGAALPGGKGTPPSFALTDPTLAAETDENQWLVVRMKASAGQWAGVYFGGAGDDQQWALPIRADNVMRTYNLWLGDYYLVPRRQHDTELASDPVRTERSAAHPDGWPGLETKMVKFQSHIPAATTSRTGVWAAGATAVTLSADEPSIVVGYPVAGPGIPDGATVVGKQGLVVTIDKPATQASLAGSPKTLTFTTVGLASPVTVFLSDAFGASGACESLKLAPRPEGPANLVVQIGGPATAMHRVGWSMPWFVRIRNMGGIAASQVSLSFAPPAGVTISNVRTYDARIPPDQHRTYYFDVTVASIPSSAPWELSLPVTVTCVQGDSATATVTGWIDAANTGGWTNPYPPEPVPIPASAKGDVEIEVWVFAGWAERDLFQWPGIIGSAERRPEYGFYEQEDPEVSAWDVYWAVTHGIDKFVVEWVDRGGDPDIKPKKYLDNGLLPSRYIDKIKYYLSYVNHEGASISPRLLSIHPDNTNPINGNPRRISVTSGSGAPTAAVGERYSFYADFAARRLYGPKDVSGWDVNSWVTLPEGTHGDGPVTSVADGRLIYCCNFLDMMRRWIPYINHPSYARSPNGNVQLSVYNFQFIHEQLNNTNVASDTLRYSDDRDAFLASMLTRAAAIILPNITAFTPPPTGIDWIAAINKNQGGPGLDNNGAGSMSLRASNMGFRGSHIYSWYGAGSPFKCMTAAASLQYAIDQHWDRQCRNGGILPRINVNTGFYNEIAEENRTPGWTVTGWDYRVMKRAFQEAKAFLEANIPAGSRKLNIEAWSEWGEGSIIGPCGRSQFMFLRALTEAFAPGWALPPILVPRDVGAKIRNVSCIHDWIPFPTAFPVEDGNTNTRQGVTIPLGSSPEVEPAKAIGQWSRRPV